MVQFSTKRSRVIDRRLLDNSISPGKPLKLREGVYKQLKDRDWLFSKLENDTVFLIHASRAYGIAVRIVDIDWGICNPPRQ
jgi:hypothetical protein